MIHVMSFEVEFYADYRNVIQYTIKTSHDIKRMIPIAW